MDDDFGVDDDFLAALAAADPGPSRSAGLQPQPQRVQQPTPQRLDRPPPPNPSTSASAPKIVQPTPQALPTRSSGSSILVSPRQKGNPVLACLRSIPWEYSDIVADYGLGLTTCALFLSLKYHRLHPEYIYARIRNLQGKYNLRVLLTMVDISNHEDSLRELAKTSLVNNVTVILCWSAAEAARYLELYKSYEHANFSAIRGQQATGYAEKLVEFVTVPRAINKADAVALVSTFGSLRHAVNADPEQVSIVGGWGERKVKAWCKAVDQPFRAKKAAKRTAKRPAAVPLREMDGRGTAKGTQPVAGGEDDFGDDDLDDLLAEAAVEGAGGGLPLKQPTPQTLPPPQKQAAPQTSPPVARPSQPEQLGGGIAAALARLRDGG
ncbi:restriction endonuclease type II-like protein [Schizothecium vesticola]|uniref:Restriction endonuclease type II-like protein n=1 Tax=Schizothecium vesticola TaxID=314040 RepID=A0AA40EPH2_9PEZI|nr:restriction endonuclease type II-like protein [Schizothecium vesticola]